MFLGDKTKQSDLLIPWATYTEPEVGHVGKYEAELTAAGVEFESYMVRSFFFSCSYCLFSLFSPVGFCLAFKRGSFLFPGRTFRVLGC